MNILLHGCFHITDYMPDMSESNRLIQKQNVSKPFMCVQYSYIGIVVCGIRNLCEIDWFRCLQFSPVNRSLFPAHIHNIDTYGKEGILDDEKLVRAADRIR